MTPLVGITVHVYAREMTYADQELREPRLTLDGQVARAVRDAGGTPVLLPSRRDLADEPEALVARLDGLFLSGGGELPARTFEGGVSPSLRATNPERYDYEVALVRVARDARVPILGVCRGMQTLAEAEGGELEPNLERLEPYRGRHYQRLPPDHTSHGARFATDSLLGRALGATAPVNSFHRQAVTRLPPGFHAVAWSDDDLIEAIEADDGLAIGTQYHPEWLYPAAPAYGEPFRWLVSTASARARARGER